NEKTKSSTVGHSVLSSSDSENGSSHARRHQDGCEDLFTERFSQLHTSILESSDERVSVFTQQNMKINNPQNIKRKLTSDETVVNKPLTAYNKVDNRPESLCQNSSDKCLESETETGKKQGMRLELSQNVEKDESSLRHGQTTPTPDISISPTSTSSSTTPTTSNRDPDSYPSTPLDSNPPSPLQNLKNKFLFVESTPETVAQAHNLIFPETPGSISGQSPNRLPNRGSSCGVFSVDLSLMKSLRLFPNNKECTCGQLVIASRESQYKILHFHNGGLEKLASVFEEWDFLSKSKK
ncbi:uncharacterized protein LOC106477343, partial [Limulus polyphemus]|uniref:Uncharacterized protein LOC106477343 n=1 Tax=Limulus polyphemus TaxID=6850 RepID=A0ABM1C372_LIMPO